MLGHLISYLAPSLLLSLYVVSSSDLNSIRRIELRVTEPLGQLEHTINVHYTIRNTKANIRLKIRSKNMFRNSELRSKYNRICPAIWDLDTDGDVKFLVIWGFRELRDVRYTFILPCNQVLRFLTLFPPSHKSFTPLTRNVLIVTLKWGQNITGLLIWHTIPPSFTRNVHTVRLKWGQNITIPPYYLTTIAS